MVLPVGPVDEVTGTAVSQGDIGVEGRLEGGTGRTPEGPLPRRGVPPAEDGPRRGLTPGRPLPSPREVPALLTVRVVV